MTESTCALTARALGEPLRGTAPIARGWLCIEDPGPWGRDALASGTIPPRVAAALADRAEALPVRIQTIRRNGRGRDGGRQVLLAHAGPGRPWLRRLRIDRDEELLDLDLGVLADPEAPPLGDQVDDAVFLVCTHARRDRCCAVWGRPVAATLAGALGDNVWETSHVGGHRFAGNVVVLPHGLVYGQVDPEGALALAQAHRRGLIDLPHLRGRSSLDRFAQAAEWYLRDRLAVRELDAVAVTAAVGDGVERSVTAAVAGRTFALGLARVPLAADRALSCGSDVVEDPGTIELTSLHEVE